MAADTSAASKKSKRAPSTAASLPEEIVSEILLLLPSRSILRFRAVCRSWAALLSSPAFRDVYAAKAHTRARRMDKFVVFAPSPNGATAVYSCARGASVADPLFTIDHMRVDFMCLSSKPCHGATLLSDTRSGTYWVCNPSTGECVPLPKQHRGLIQSSAGLVYDDRTKERKVVHLFSKDRDLHCEIYTLCVPNGKWRPASHDLELLVGSEVMAKLINALQTQDSVTKTPPVFANGCLHWLAYPNTSTDMQTDVVLCFSVATETFQLLNAPASVHVEEHSELDEYLPAVPMHLAELEGSLCLVHDLRRRGQGRSWLDVWMLRDPAASEWSLDYRIAVTPLLALDLHSPRFITILGCSSGGKSCAGNGQEKRKILIATSQHQVHAYDPDKGDIELVFSAPQTNIRISQKQAAVALWLGPYEDNLVQIDGGNRREKEVLSIITKILVRLSVKSITQSMLVCKQWCSLVESESFITTHMSEKRPARILMANNGRARRAFFDFTSVKNWLQATDPALADTLVSDKIICSKPCHGLNLISTYTDDFMCNPCTGATKCLGRHGKSNFTPAGHHHHHAFSVGRNIGFGFDQSTREHVAVEIGYVKGTLACMIKTSSEKQWSCIGKPPMMVSDMPSAHVDGTLYWMSEPKHEHVIVALDISTRAFSILPCELSMNNDVGHTFLVELKGTLSLVTVNARVGEMDIWMKPKNDSSWVGVYKLCLDEQPDYSLKTGQVVMPMEIDDANDVRILLNTGRALGYYDSKTGTMDNLYSMDQLNLPRSSLAFPILCQESLVRIQEDELPNRPTLSGRPEGFRCCGHLGHVDAMPGRRRPILLKCEGGACVDIAVIYRSCCRRLLCVSCQRRCLEHSPNHILRLDPVFPISDYDVTMVRPDSTLPFCHPSVPGPEFIYHYTTKGGDVVRHVFISLEDYVRSRWFSHQVECGYRMEGDVVKESWVRRYLKL